MKVDAGFTRNEILFGTLTLLSLVVLYMALARVIFQDSPREASWALVVWSYAASVLSAYGMGHGHECACHKKWTSQLLNFLLTSIFVPFLPIYLLATLASSFFNPKTRQPVRRVKASPRRSSFRLGERVSFPNPRGGRTMGMIGQFSKKSVVVIGGPGEAWRVPYDLLEKALKRQPKTPGLCLVSPEKNSGV